jgi:hypothetical protein
VFRCLISHQSSTRISSQFQQSPWIIYCFPGNIFDYPFPLSFSFWFLFLNSDFRSTNICSPNSDASSLLFLSSLDRFTRFCSILSNVLSFCLFLAYTSCADNNLLQGCSFCIGLSKMCYFFFLFLNKFYGCVLLSMSNTIDIIALTFAVLAPISLDLHTCAKNVHDFFFFFSLSSALPRFLGGWDRFQFVSSIFHFIFFFFYFNLFFSQLILFC